MKPWMVEADGHRRSAICSSLPALSEFGDRVRGTSAVRVSVEKSAVFRSQEFAGGEKILLREQCRHQSRQRAAALVKLDGRRSPRGKRAGGLAARESERFRHGRGIEPEQTSHRRGGAKRTDDAGPVPAALARFGIIEAEPDACRYLTAGCDRDQQIAARQSVALRDGECGRYHFRRDVGERGAVNVAHGDGGDQVAVQQGCAGERQAVAADDTALVRLRKARCKRRQLVGFLALVTRHRARERVEQHVLAVFAYCVAECLRI